VSRQNLYANDRVSQTPFPANLAEPTLTWEMAAYPARLGEICDGISDGAEIQRAPKNPLKTASSGADVNPSVPPIV
jgi:hypothetical protein